MPYPAISSKEVMPQLTPEATGQLLENQTKELELKAQELALRKQQDDHSFEFSKQALDAQVSDREKQRCHNDKLKRDQYILNALLSLTIMPVIIVSLYLNKESIAIEIIKVIVFIFAGGVG